MPGVAAEPVVVIRNVHAVDDAGSTHYESVWTARFIKSLVDDDVLRFEKNIRPDHMADQRMGTKTRRKIETWARELLANNAVIGNLSVRVDPDNSLFEIQTDEDGEQHLILQRGNLDTAVDSESRLKAIVRALASPMGGLTEDTKFAVRVWIANDELAHRVAANYNTRGDKVNDSAAKFAYQETAEQRLARQLVQESVHLGLDNVEVLSNAVSANSHKLAAFNTLAKGLELFWHGEPLNREQEDAQVAFLVSFWDQLVRARPEYGRLTKAQRKQVRDVSVSGTAVSIHGLISAASTMYTNKLDPKEFLPRLKVPYKSNGTEIDYFSTENPTWQDVGVLVQAKGTNGNSRLVLRTSFQSRDAMAAELHQKLGLPLTHPLREK